MAESADADASSYNIGSPMSLKMIPGEYLSEGCDILSDVRGMTGMVAPGVGVVWFKSKPFGYAESIESARECSVTRETDLVL